MSFGFFLWGNTVCYTDIADSHDIAKALQKMVLNTNDALPYTLLLTPRFFLIKL